MPEKIRYITHRKNKDGSYRYYWQRKGFRPKRLPDDETARNMLAIQYNAAADDNLPAEDAYPVDTVGWVIDSYKSTDKYKKLADGTKRYYDNYMDDFKDLGALIPLSFFDRGMIIDFVETYENVGDQRKAAAVLRNLYNRATYKGVVAENLANKLDISTVARREIVWPQPIIDEFDKAIHMHNEAQCMYIAFYLHVYTAQRPSDVLKMLWSDYDGEKIKCIQQKTKKPVAIPVHGELKKILDAAKEVATSPYIVEFNQQQLSYNKFNKFFREIRQISCIDPEFQTRDLRRTAMVRMAEAGAEIQDIAAVSGHTIENTTQILETYLPRTYLMAKRAIGRWDKSEKR
jgi:integrase